MSSNQARTPYARQMPLNPRTTSASSPIYPRDSKVPAYHLEDAMRPDESTAARSIWKNSSSQCGKRKRLLTRDGHDQGVDENDKDDASCVTSSKNVPSMASAKQWKKRPKTRPRVALESVIPSIQRRDDGYCRDRTDESVEGLTQCLDLPSGGNWQVLDDSQSFPSSYIELDISRIIENHSAATRHHQTAEPAQDQLSSTVGYPSTLFPAQKAGWPHSLSELQWPFSDFSSNRETKRGGGGGGSQPSTTGSQGWPHFVTAGPDMSLFGNSLFGYDGNELMGCISWA